MRTALLTAPREVSIVDVAESVPGVGEVLLRLTAVGVCGSDVHFFHEMDLVRRYADGVIKAVIIPSDR